MKEPLTELVMEGEDFKEKFEQMSSLDRISFFKTNVPASQQSKCFLFLRPSEQAVVLKDISLHQAGEIFNSYDHGTKLSLLNELPQITVEKLLPYVGAELLDEIGYKGGFAEGSIGRIMLPPSLLYSIRPSWTSQEIMDHLKQNDSTGKLDLLLFVTDNNQVLLGVLNLRKLMLADKETTAEELMEVAPRTFDPKSPATELNTMLKAPNNKDPLVAVVNDGVLCGAVTFSLAFERYERSAVEMLQSPSMQPLKVNYSKARLWILYRKRIVWLLLLVLINLGSSGIIKAFEDTLESNVALAYFIPLLIDTGGNIGAQSATLVISSLSAKDIGLGQWPRILLREFIVSLLIGSTLMGAGWVLAFFIGNIGVAFSVAFAMISIAIMANVIGAMLPFVITKLRMDPAAASSPLITTILDVCGLSVYFAFAILFVGK